MRRIQISRRTFLTLAAAAFSCRGRDRPSSAERGRAFLAGLLDPELGLLPEFRGARVYWLSHDNYLAAKVLAASHPAVARTIAEALRREGPTQSDGKTELLFGEKKGVLPFRHHRLITVREAGAKAIRTEIPTERLLLGWEGYADLLFFASIAEVQESPARQHWESAMRMWDGMGFNDAATPGQKSYATFKLALASIAARRLSPAATLPPALIDRLRALQDDSGGWITNYDAGGRPIGVANVETSCLAILGLEALRGHQSG